MREDTYIYICWNIGINRVQQTTSLRNNARAMQNPQEIYTLVGISI